jgi:O-antigen ligase
LGFTAQRYDVGTKKTVDSDLFHNIAFDVWLRLGLIGLLLAAGAALTLAGEALRSWRRATDTQVAGLALGGVVALAALLAKGMVESILEKDRLVVMLAVALGLMASATLAADQPRSESGPRGELERGAVA